MRRIGIVQGRLLPPVGGRVQAFPGARWEDEFPLAARAGLDAVELVWERAGRPHDPLVAPDGAGRLRGLAARTGVVAASVVADRLLESPVIRAGRDGRAALAEEARSLLRRCGEAAIERVVLPFVDASSLGGRRDEDVAVGWLGELLEPARAAKVELHLETDYPPAAFAALLERLDDPIVAANYDTGNSAALGFDPGEEFAAYGQRIGSVHVKDRVRGGSTVPLGAGDAELDRVFAGLAELGYAGDVVLQVARGPSGEELAWARRNAKATRALWRRVAA